MLKNDTARAIYTQINKNGIQIISSGGKTEKSIVNNAGAIHIYSNGSAYDTTVNKGGKLILHDNAYISGATVKNGGNITLTHGGSATNVDIKKGGIFSYSAGANGAYYSSVNIASGGTLHLATQLNTYDLSGLKNGSIINLDISKKTKGFEYYHLQLTTSEDTNSLHSGKYVVTVGKWQKVGEYGLTSNVLMKNKTKFTMKIGTTTLGVATLSSGALNKYGVSYKISMTNYGYTYLTVSTKFGKMYKGTAKSNKMNGTSHSDIFFGGNGNDVIKGVNGHDVAVYDKSTWGKDKIYKTDGTMTLLFKGLKAKDITKKLNGTTMTITRKGKPSQTITIQGWSKNTHSIVFGGTMNAFSKWLNASKPSTKQITMARNEVWKKAGLASA